MKSIPPTRKTTLKSVKKDAWTSRCLPGVTVDRSITKMVTHTKMEPQGLQHNNFKYETTPFQQSTCQRLAADKGLAPGVKP